MSSPISIYLDQSRSISNYARLEKGLWLNMNSEKSIISIKDKNSMKNKKYEEEEEIYLDEEEDIFIFLRK